MASRAILSLVGDAQGYSAHYHVLLAAKLSTTASDTPVTIHELWLDGAVVEGVKLPPVGKDVLLSRGGNEAFGAVSMSRSGRCVVEFEESLDEGELLMWLHAPGEKILPMLYPRVDRPQSRNVDEWNLTPHRDYLPRKGVLGD